MILWFLAAQIGIAVIGGLLCLLLGVIGRSPNDLSMGIVALVTILLFAQLVVTIVSPLAGNSPRGDLTLLYVYLISALLLPLIGGFWALIERNRWSTMILGGICLSVAVMLYRMGQIWFEGH